eukprot:CAMPEP_0170956542 /NCGR_PEP_ID=MMETSP0735-20130129/34059_1 /TAXON_ID=186038 /ORGANISM="Fragilariopsis kerguelensis, Strain L26-C5" /LENGTH=268 /DNA_ID=CAMNT_0011369069 /DNA_START=55 /DNA_END=861 /DNA_ORIENTATION=-
MTNIMSYSPVVIALCCTLWRKERIAVAFIVISSLCAVTFVVVSGWTLIPTTTTLLGSSSALAASLSSSAASSRRLFLDQATKIVVVPLVASISSPAFATADEVSGEGSSTDAAPAIVELAATAVVDDYEYELMPLPGHKIQLNASAFTVNDFECLQLDTKIWPSERVHCELRPPRPPTATAVAGEDNNNKNNIAQYDFVVEHFDDPYCKISNTNNPSVRHTASGCYNFVKSNHSYNDVCHPNRTFTISAFDGLGCMSPMPVTAVNLLP